MTLSGTVLHGAIVLDDPQPLPEGARVEILLKPAEDQPKNLQDVLLEQAGCMTDLPADMAEQHDHCTHVTPKP
jgi:hypothetical protein